MEVGYLYSGKEESESDRGGFIFKGRFLEAIRETLVRWDILGNL